VPLDILIAAISRQGDGLSIAGLVKTPTGAMKFARLVAPTPTGILYSQHYGIYVNDQPRLWDLIRVEAPWADCRPSQPENLVVNHTAWQLLERPARLPWLQLLEQMPLAAGPLFGTSEAYLRASSSPLPSSLAYLEIGDAVGIGVWDPARERYRARLRFQHGGASCELPLTDARYSAAIRARGDGEWPISHLGCRAPHGLRLIVSITEPFRGRCYKVVASILPRRTATLWRDAFPKTFSAAVRHTALGLGQHVGSHLVGA